MDIDYMNCEIRLQIIGPHIPKNRNIHRTDYFSSMMKEVCQAVVNRIGEEQNIKTMDRCEATIASMEEDRQLRMRLGGCVPLGEVRFWQREGLNAFDLTQLQTIAMALQKETQNKLGYEINTVELVIKCPDDDELGYTIE